MRHDLEPGNVFPDYQLPDHTNTPRRLSELQGDDPLILTLSRGHYCPKEHQQHLDLAAFYPKIAVAYTQVATISTDDHHTLQEFRASVRAQWTFLSDPDRTVQKDLDIAEYTDPEHDPMIPHTLVLKPGLIIHSIYNGYWFWGRPSVVDLWHDLRAVTSEIRPDWDLSTPGLREAWNAGIPRYVRCQSPQSSSGIRGIIILVRLRQGLGAFVMRLLIFTTIILVMSYCASAQTYTINTIAGDGAPGSSGDKGPATSAQLNNPRGIAVDPAGSVYIADHLNSRIRKISGGVITTVAGGGTTGYADNSSATSAGLFLPMGVAVDLSGNLYIADTGHHTVRKVSNGVITTVAGNGTIGFHGEGDKGPATSAQLYLPRAVAIDSVGDLYIADVGAGRVRRVSNGIITTVAGGGPIRENSDNMPATSAYLPSPNGVALDSAGTLYIANTLPIGVYKVANGVLTTIPGNGLAPYGMAVDPSGGLYISDQFGFVFKIANGRITTIAGNAQGSGFGGDGGPATSAQLSDPAGIAVDSAGRVYLADTSNNRIRVLVPSGPASIPSISAITNAASNLPGDISPGEIIVLYGSGLGPEQLVKAAPGFNGSFGTQCADTRVFVNGTAAPMIYASATQTSAVVPYGITGRPQVTVSDRGEMSAGVSVWMIASAPGIFTYDSSGRGPAAALNQDGITPNTSATPTHIGDIISIYATGEGDTTPAGVDGKPASVPFPYPKLRVTATVGDQVAPVTYAGGAPGIVAGLMQVNVQIPAGIQLGNDVPVVLRVGELLSQSGVTIAVR